MEYEDMHHTSQPDPVPVAVKVPMSEVIVRAEKMTTGGYQLTFDVGNIAPFILAEHLVNQQHHAVRFPHLQQNARINEWLNSLPNLEYQLNVSFHVQTATQVVLKINNIQKTGLRYRNENKLRKDRKHKGMFLYISMLGMINKTWGRVSELIDAWNVLIDNLYSLDIFYSS